MKKVLFGRIGYAFVVLKRSTNDSFKLTPEETEMEREVKLKKNTETSLVSAFFDLDRLRS